MWIGLDFGTTNSSVAVSDGHEVRLLPLDPRAGVPTVLRSALFITREGVPVIGREAIDRFTAGNVGREIEYVWRYVGETEITFDDNIGTIMQALYARVDGNAPGRLFQSLKSSLRDRSYRGTNVFGTYYTLEALIGLVLRMIVERTEARLGTAVSGLVIGKPVRYAFDAASDALAFSRMRHACEVAGLPAVYFLPEPTAAAMNYARTVAGTQTILVFDFGGGTLDVTILRVDHGKRHVLASDGVPIGGDLLDQRIVMGKLLPHFGAGATLGPRRLPLPAHLLEHLAEWQSIIDLSQPRYIQIIDEAIAIGDKPKELQALRSLARHNYGLPLYAQVEQAKVALSDAASTSIEMHMGEIDFSEQLERWDFERLIGPDVRKVEDCIDRALILTGLTPEQIDVVIRTGGSSRIPRFVRLLARKFGEDKLQEMDVFTGVAAGLGVVAGDLRLQDELRASGDLIS